MELIVTAFKVRRRPGEERACVVQYVTNTKTIEYFHSVDLSMRGQNVTMVYSSPQVLPLFLLLLCGLNSLIKPSTAFMINVLYI